MGQGRYADGAWVVLVLVIGLAVMAAGGEFDGAIRDLRWQLGMQ